MSNNTKSKECSHAWSFKDRDSYNFEWNTSKEFNVIEFCEDCKIERESTYQLIKINNEWLKI